MLSFDVHNEKSIFLTLFFHFVEWWLMSHYLCIFYLLLLVIIYIYCFKNDLAKSVEGIFNLSIYPYLNPRKNVGSFHRIPQCYFIFHIAFYRGKKLTFIQPKTRMLFWLFYSMKILLLYSRSSFIHIVLINENSLTVDFWLLMKFRLLLLVTHESVQHSFYNLCGSSTLSSPLLVLIWYCKLFIIQNYFSFKN